MLVRISGVVSSGLGRAHVFMAQKHYQEQFVKLMGKTVWPGTLNLSVSQSNLINYIALRMKSGIKTAHSTVISFTMNLALNAVAPPKEIPSLRNPLIR